MEGQVCLFSSNRRCDCTNWPPVSPDHARPESSRMWRTCWNSKAQNYGRNVGRWLLQCGCQRQLCVSACAGADNYSGWTTLVSQRRSLEVIKQTPLSHIFSSVPLMYKAPSFLPFCLSLSGTFSRIFTDMISNQSVGIFNNTKLIKLIHTTERWCLRATNARKKSAPQQPTLLETLRKCEK